MDRAFRAALSLSLLAVLGAAGSALAQARALPIIDMHLHALPAGYFGPPPASICMGAEFPAMDPREGPKRIMSCPAPVLSPATDDEMMRATLAALERYDITAVTSGSGALVERWRAAAPQRIIPGFFLGDVRTVTVDSVRRLHQAGKLAALAEITTQYAGLSPSDSVLEPYFALAEELDIPVGIHMGPGPPGAPYVGYPAYRGRLSNPLLLEEMLARHPKLRVWICHAGWPFLDETLALLYTHPQVYVDVGVIDYLLPRPEFHAYLRRLVQAGFGSRVLFGSDQMLWPQTIGSAIGSIQSADFLTEQQKRDILYNNAVRFLRLDRKVSVR